MVRSRWRFLVAWFQPVGELIQGRRVVTMDGRKRATRQLGNLFEFQASPDSSDHDLAAQEVEPLEKLLGIGRECRVMRQKPDRLLFRGTPVMVLSATFGSSRIEGLVPNRRVQPTDIALRGRVRMRQIDKRFLHDIVGVPSPLARVESQRRCIPPNQLAQSCVRQRGHRQTGETVSTGKQRSGRHSPVEPREQCRAI